MPEPALAITSASLPFLALLLVSQRTLVAGMLAAATRE